MFIQWKIRPLKGLGRRIMIVLLYSFIHSYLNYVINLVKARKRTTFHEHKRPQNLSPLHFINAHSNFKLKSPIHACN